MKRNMLLVGLAIVAATSLAQEYIIEDFPVSDSTGYIYKLPSISAMIGGEVAMAWEQSGGNGLWMKTFSVADGALSDVKRVTAPFSHNYSYIAHGNNGDFMVMYAGYATSWSLFAQLYDIDGTELRDTLLITRHYTEFFDYMNASLAVDETGNFVVMFPGHDSVMVERISPAGDFVGEMISLLPGMSSVNGLKGVMNPSGNFILNWTDMVSGNLYIQLFDTGGGSLGDPIQVNALEEGHSVKDRKLSTDGPGNFVVVWEEAVNGIKDLHSQYFSPAGEKVGNAITLTDGEAVYTGNMSVDMDLDGKYVVVWSDGRKGDTTALYLQQLDQEGQLAGTSYPATTVNVQNPGTAQELTTQNASAVRILNDTIYLTWENFNPNLYYYQEIYANVLRWKQPDNTGVRKEDPLLNSIRLVPNPTTGIFRLIMEDPGIERASVEVVNIEGQIIYRRNDLDVRSPVELDLTGQPAGLYYLKVRKGPAVTSRPLVLMDP